MTVRELIHALLNYDMNQDVVIEYSAEDFPLPIVSVRGREDGEVVVSRYDGTAIRDENRAP